MKSEVRGQLNVNYDIITPQDESVILDDPEDIYHVGVKKIKSPSKCQFDLIFYKNFKAAGIECMNSKEIVDSYTDNDTISLRDLVKSNDLEEACDVRLKANISP